MNELEQRKLEAEIANLNAETARAMADAKKADDERASLRRSWRDWSIEAIKVVGAFVLGVGGMTAAITGYQISEVKKERMDLEISKIHTELEELTRTKAATEAAVAQARQQLASLTTEVAGLQTTLEAVRTASVTRTDKLDAAIIRAAEIGTAISDTKASLQSAPAAGRGSHQIGDYLVGLQTLGLADETRTALNSKLKAVGYGLHALTASYQSVERPSWFAARSTVLYYSSVSKAAATELARVLNKLTGEAFVVQPGAGSGVDPSEREVTLFVHYVSVSPYPRTR
jgi:DNA gyrase/topoisomerase IV subunit A